MVIAPENTSLTLRTSTSWSTLHGKRLISLRTKGPVQQLIDKCFERGRVVPNVVMAINSLDTLIAMVEAGEGMAVIPSFGVPACRNRRVVMTRLVNPIATLDFHPIQNRGRKLPPVVGEFTSFLQNYIAGWAGRAGVL
jgi:LysR family transcriptional regulator, carnitine catabolism transcriptional activator